MTKYTNQEFVIFQKEFKKWQKLFGLSGYKIYFKHQPLEDSFAQIDCNQVSRVATVSLNSSLPDKDEPLRDVRHSAKHEAIHLMLEKLTTLALSRYVRDGEIYEATEELVFKLEELINA